MSNGPSPADSVDATGDTAVVEEPEPDSVRLSKLTGVVGALEDTFGEKAVSLRGGLDMAEIAIDYHLIEPELLTLDEAVEKGEDAEEEDVGGEDQLEGDIFYPNQQKIIPAHHDGGVSVESNNDGAFTPEETRKLRESDTWVLYNITAEGVHVKRAEDI